MRSEDALSLAITLLHEPGLRHDWRREPLPADIARLLALVGGEPNRLEQAANALGARPDDLLQAARFYVQEILLFAGADDRRLLGLADGDGADTIRSHYRCLQSWLHPDRGGASRAETVHAARVNAAWNRLRAGTANRAVAPVREDTANRGHARTPAPATRVRHWMRIEEQAERQPKRWLLAIPVTIAIGGGWLWMASHPPIASGDAWPGIEEPGTESGAMPGDGPGTANAEPATLAPPTPATAQSAYGQGGAPPGISSAVRQPVYATALRAVQPAAPIQPPAAPAATSAAMPAATQATAAVPSAILRTGPEAGMANAGVPEAIRPEQPVVVDSPAPLVVATLTTHQADADTPAAPAVVPTPAPAPPATPDLAGRDVAARQRGEALLAYLTRPQQATPPPIWHSGQALDEATAVRRDLVEGGRHRPQVLHGQAHWQIEPVHARLQVPVEAAGHAGPRLLQAGLRWENDAWWVESIALEEPR